VGEENKVVNNEVADLVDTGIVVNPLAASEGDSTKGGEGGEGSESKGSVAKEQMSERARLRVEAVLKRLHLEDKGSSNEIKEGEKEVVTSEEQQQQKKMVQESNEAIDRATADALAGANNNNANTGAFSAGEVDGDRKSDADLPQGATDSSLTMAINGKITSLNPESESEVESGKSGRYDGVHFPDCTENTSDPFDEIPVDIFKPPQQAAFSLQKQWERAVQEMTTRVSRMNVGGDPLRAFIRDEVEALQGLRLKLFCKEPSGTS
jgi:hypothetical protein